MPPAASGLLSTEAGLAVVSRVRRPGAYLDSDWSTVAALSRRRYRQAVGIVRHTASYDADRSQACVRDDGCHCLATAQTTHLDRKGRWYAKPEGWEVQ